MTTIAIFYLSYYACFDDKTSYDLHLKLGMPEYWCNDVSNDGARQGYLTYLIPVSKISHDDTRYLKYSMT